MDHSSTRPCRPLNAWIVQNFHLVWLDENIDEINNDDCRHSITKLWEVINTVDTFNDIDECIDFISDTEDRQIFMMVSGIFSQIIIPIIQNICQVNSVFIFCENKIRHEECSKVKGVYTDITSICQLLKQAAQDCDQKSVSINFVKSIDGTSKDNLGQLDQSFMYSQLMKEILLTVDFEQGHINEFLIYCREQFVVNTVQLNNIKKFEKEYSTHQPIWWYTYDSFLYSMLNRALRMMEVDLIIKMGFFVCDLHNNIARLHAEQYSGQTHLDSFIVYRGQGLSQKDFDQLMNTKDGLMSFNNFLSTSLDRSVSLAFAESNKDNPHMIGVLFIITVNPSISSTCFANIENVSAYQTEEEILFSMHSVFRIGKMEQIGRNNRLWQVDLTLTDDNDPQLYALTENLREETKGSEGWFRLGQLMITLGQFDKAEQLFETLIQQTNTDNTKAYLFHELAWVKSDQKKYLEALHFYEKSHEIFQKILPPNHRNLASSYNNIGGVYRAIGECSKALCYYEKAAEIDEKNLPKASPHLASSYDNIGLVYQKMNDYTKALSFCEKALEIREKILPPNHPDLGTSYNNIANLYGDIGEYSKVLSYYERAVNIWQRSLPPNHPHLQFIRHNIQITKKKL